MVALPRPYPDTCLAHIREPASTSIEGAGLRNEAESPASGQGADQSRPFSLSTSSAVDLQGAITAIVWVPLWLITQPYPKLAGSLPSEARRLVYHTPSRAFGALAAPDPPICAGVESDADQDKVSPELGILRVTRRWRPGLPVHFPWCPPDP